MTIIVKITDGRLSIVETYKFRTDALFAFARLGGKPAGYLLMAPL